MYAGLFTHYKREEDAAMKSGKFDEELARMSDIVDHLTPNSMLLFNESFAATNDREGSEIARQIVCALLESRIKVFFVTHLYEPAYGMSKSEAEDTLFLRAERKADGTRTFKLVEVNRWKPVSERTCIVRYFRSARRTEAQGLTNPLILPIM